MKKLLYPIISMYKRDDMVDAFSVNITIFLSNAKTKRFTISQYFRVKGDAITYRNSLIQELEYSIKKEISLIQI